MLKEVLLGGSSVAGFSPPEVGSVPSESPATGASQVSFAPSPNAFLTANSEQVCYSLAYLRRPGGGIHEDVFQASGQRGYVGSTKPCPLLQYRTTTKTC